MQRPGAVLGSQVITVPGPLSGEGYGAFDHRPFVNVDMEPAYSVALAVDMDKLIDAVSVQVVDGCLHGRGRMVAAFRGSSDFLSLHQFLL